jgi:2-polyprenyl-3-methyl-5-hydroxy-6-metoxy-1,4-benzoquinol methylase
MSEPVDRAKVKEFADRLLEIYTGGFLTYMIEIGEATGIFTAAADGPTTAAGLAERAGLSERHVREWLGAMVVAGIFRYEPADAIYSLPPEHATCLTGSSPYNLAPRSLGLSRLGKVVPKVIGTFKHGGGVPYPDYMPDFTELMDALGRHRYDNLLVSVYLGLAPGLRERLGTGISVADIGCGSGHVANLLAQAFPKSDFVGYDMSANGIGVATAEAASMGLANVRFELLDLVRLHEEPKFDLITAFDVIHDQAQPAEVLSRVNGALAPDGTFFMFDIRASSRLEENIPNRMAPYLYSISVLHCMQVSLADGGAGLGTCWGEQLARKMLADAGFRSVQVFEPPLDPTNLLYLCTR